MRATAATERRSSFGQHFETWNGWAYDHALARFLLKACRLPQVHCVSFRELANYLDSLTAAERAPPEPPLNRSSTGRAHRCGRCATGSRQLLLGLLALAVAGVWIAHLFVGAIHDRNHLHDTMTITGSAHVPITSNLVHWSVSVTGSAWMRAEAASTMRHDLATPRAFLRRSGIPDAAIQESVVESETPTMRLSKTKTRTAYHVTQGLDVSTGKIDAVEGASVHLAVLIEDGIDISADPLEYVSTDLDAAKHRALKAATEEARRRADILVTGLGDRLGPMRSASLGVYQITQRDSTDVSDYGINDTSTRDKDVTAVVSATFAVET